MCTSATRPVNFCTQSLSVPSCERMPYHPRITAVEILGKDAGDSPQFKPLMKTTATNFKIGEVSADKAYLSTENIDTVFQFGGTPYIAFKANSTGRGGRSV